MIERWLVAFALTLVVEVPLAVVIVRAQASRVRVAMIAALATVISHPILSFVLLQYLPGSYPVRVLCGEIVVVAIETVVLERGLRLRRGYALAIAATINAASYLVGLVVVHG